MARRAPAKTQKVKRDVNAALRAASALRMKAAQPLATYADIAAACGYASAGAAHNAVQRELARVVEPAASDMRAAEFAMLQELHTTYWLLAVGDPAAPEPDEDDDEETAKDKRRRRKPNLFAGDRILAIAERRARLMGLDARPEDAGQTNVTRRYIGVDVEAV